MKRQFYRNQIVVWIIILALLVAVFGLVGCGKPATTPITPTKQATGIIPPPASASNAPTPSFSLASPSPSLVPPSSTPGGASPAPSSPPPSREPTSSPPVPSPTGPQVKIIAPQDGNTLANGDITVQVQVSNFNLVDKIGQPNASGEGHIIYYLDTVPPTVPNTAATAKPNSSAASAGTSNIWKNVPAGQHSFLVQLVNKDNTPLDPPAVTGITVNVKTSQTITIDLVAENISFNLSSMTVQAGAQVVINFTNRDLGIPHNLDVFQAGGGAKWSIFTGHSITGVSTIVYKFIAPTVPAPYKFQCDFHPLQMNGIFNVIQP